MSVASLSTATSDSDIDFELTTDIASNNGEEISIEGRNFIQRLLLKVKFLLPHVPHDVMLFFQVQVELRKKTAYSCHFFLLQDPDHQNEHLKDIFSESINWKKTVSVTNHARKKFSFLHFLYLMSHQSQ